MRKGRFWDFKTDEAGKIKEPLHINRAKNEPLYDMFEIEYLTSTGRIKTIKVFCEPGAIDPKTMYEGLLNEYIGRIFNSGGLMQQQQRDDYIFLGRIEKANDGRASFNHDYRVQINGRNMTAQQFFDNVALPVLVEKFGENQQVQNTQVVNSYAEQLYNQLIQLLQDGNLARRNGEFEDVLQKLSLYIAKLDNYNLRGNAIKFVSKETLEKKCGEGAYAANMPSDNNSIYLSPECLRSIIQRQKSKNEYDPRALAVMIINIISHEIKHNKQGQYEINAKSGNYEFDFQEWLNAMYSSAQVIRRTTKLSYLEDSKEAEAYDTGMSGARKFLKSINREDDMEMDRPILNKNLPFQKFAASYGNINFHRENDGRIVNIAEYLDNAFNETSSRRKNVGAFKEKHPILVIQYDDNGNLKSVQELAHQYISRTLVTDGKLLHLTDKDISCLEFAYCFVFADRLTRWDTEQLYKTYGKVEVDRLLAGIKEKAIILKDKYSKSYQQGTEAIRDKNFNHSGDNPKNNVQKNIVDIHAKYNASQRYFQQVIDKLNRANAFPSAPNGNFER